MKDSGGGEELILADFDGAFLSGGGEASGRA